uniref:Uncharacterized protein n=1 Tax=Anopheles atroparvus TaxID=41427 RepID=A0AAG5DHR3_ANOAO
LDFPPEFRPRNSCNPSLPATLRIPAGPGSWPKGSAGNSPKPLTGAPRPSHTRTPSVTVLTHTKCISSAPGPPVPHEPHRNCRGIKEI